jgi:hypothetical protein
MIKATSLSDGKLNHLFSTRGEADLARNNPLTTSNDSFNGVTYLAQFDTQVAQHLRGNTFTLTHKAEQKMLGANVTVLEAPRFFLGQRQHCASPLCEPVEAVPIIKKVRWGGAFSLKCFAYPLSELI